MSVYDTTLCRSQDAIDKGKDVGESAARERETLNDPAFVTVKSRLGTGNLRLFITRILADKMKNIIPELRSRAMIDRDEAVRKLREEGRVEDGDMDLDDLIARLVEKAIQKMRIYLQGLSTEVNKTEESTGAKLNKRIKSGAFDASREARQTYSVEEFKTKLSIARTNMDAIRDSSFPIGIVLDIGVSLLTECYRQPFLRLLEDASQFLNNEISMILRDTLGTYPKFQELVTEVALREVDFNRDKAEEYLNIYMDVHKRFVNCNHSDFKKMKKVTKKIKSKNHFNIWFKERIPTAEENNSNDDSSKLGTAEVLSDGEVFDAAEVAETHLDISLTRLADTRLFLRME